MSFLQLSFADQEVSINRKQTRAEIIPIRANPKDAFPKASYSKGSLRGGKESLPQRSKELLCPKDSFGGGCPWHGKLSKINRLVDWQAVQRRYQ